MFEINYSQLIKYRILKKLVTSIPMIWKQWCHDWYSDPFCTYQVIVLWIFCKSCAGADLEERDPMLCCCKSLWKLNTSQYIWTSVSFPPGEKTRPFKPEWVFIVNYNLWAIGYKNWKYSRDLKSYHSKSGFSENQIFNGPFFKWLCYSPDHLITGPFEIQTKSYKFQIFR